MNFGDTGTYGAGNALIVYEGFKVYGGQMHAVEAFMKVLPKDTPERLGKDVEGNGMIAEGRLGWTRL